MFIEKMPLIEGIGDEVTNFFILLITITVIYFAWRSTNVRENRVQRAGAVFIFDYNRRIRDHRVAQNPFTMSILRSSSRQSNSSNATEELEIEEQITSQVDELSATISEPPNLLTVLDEINNLNTGQNHHIGDSGDTGPEQIIQEMDRDSSDGLRRRHVNYNMEGDENHARIDEPLVSALNFNELETANSENCSNENNENINLNRITNESATSQNQRKLLEEAKFENIPSTPAENEIRIKLKYLNDDLKLVSGFPSEPVGDFKKRNFTVELAEQKSVRLVFNGHVLQPDTKTLQSCGLFDNCVVHCLIHNKKPNQMHGDDGNRPANNQNEGNENFNLPQSPHTSNRDRAENGPLLIYLGMCFISLVLVCGWYCRFRYNFLFSWFSTTGLVIMTLLFLVMIPLNVLLERESTG